MPPPPNDFDLLVNLIITSFGCVALVFSSFFFFKYILRVFSFVAILRDTFLPKTTAHRQRTQKTRQNIGNTRWQIQIYVQLGNTKRIFHNTHVICTNTHEIPLLFMSECIWNRSEWRFAWFLHFRCCCVVDCCCFLSLPLIVGVAVLVIFCARSFICLAHTVIYF